MNSRKAYPKSSYNRDQSHRDHSSPCARPDGEVTSASSKSTTSTVGRGEQRADCIACCATVLWRETTIVEGAWSWPAPVSDQRAERLDPPRKRPDDRGFQPHRRIRVRSIWFSAHNVPAYRAVRCRQLMNARFKAAFPGTSLTRRETVESVSVHSGLSGVVNPGRLLGTVWNRACVRNRGDGRDGTCLRWAYDERIERNN